MINLIAKNKIADYIYLHPEAQTALLTWLKEHAAHEERSIAHMLERPHMEQVFTMMGGVGRGDYQVECRTNYPLKTTCVAWVGSKEELEARERAKIDKRKSENPGLQSEVKVKVVEVVLIPPLPISLNIGLEAKADGQQIVHQARQPVPVAEVPYIENDSDFKAAAEYEEALARAITIFESLPGSPEFDELTKLIPLIARYEQNKLTLPELKMWQVVKHKMDMLEITPQSLPAFIGTADEIDLYLDGKQSLSIEKLDWLYNFLFIKFRV